MAKQISKHENGSFSATIEVNLREQCKAVTTRRGVVVSLKDESEFGEKKTNEGVVKTSEIKRVSSKKREHAGVATNVYLRKTLEKPKRGLRI